jgi:hypothetical protein
VDEAEVRAGLGAIKTAKSTMKNTKKAAPPSVIPTSYLIVISSVAEGSSS